MTTMLKFISLAGKGGARSDNFVESFRNLFPRALPSIITDIWIDLQSIAPHELSLHIGNSKECASDPYGSSIRDWTVVQTNPDDNYTYLLANPKYFREKVCSWYGNVNDGHIGSCDQGKTAFEKITPLLSTQVLEESDLEEDLLCIEDALNHQSDDRGNCQNKQVS